MPKTKKKINKISKLKNTAVDRGFYFLNLIKR